MTTRYSRSKFVQASLQLLATYPLGSVARAMAQEIMANHWQRDLDLILQEVARQLLRTQGHAEVEVTTARPVTAATLAQVKRELKQYLDAQTITVQATVEPTLKGGAIIRTPRGWLDVSVRQRLNQLAQL